MKHRSTHKKLLLFTTLMLLVSMNCSAKDASIENVGAETFAGIIELNKSNPNVVILDIRTPAEFRAGHIAGAVMLDFYSSTFARDFKNLDRSKTYLVYCRSGNRSGQLMRAITNLGFKKVYNLESGIKDWLGKGYPLKKI